MSRTYRRKKADKHKYLGWMYFTDTTTPRLHNYSWSCDTVWWYYGESYEEYPTEHQMATARARYHSDAATSSFKEPGPSWFRRMFETRPSRRKNKRELQRYMLDTEYEPMCFDKGPLDYWT